MKSFALLGLAALASATGVANTTTVVSTAFTTVCPSPTTLYYGDKVITVTGSTTLTITDCPCTFTTPAAWKNGTTVVPTTAKPATTTKGTTGVPVGTTGTTKAPVGTTGTKTTPVVVTGTGSTASTVATAGAVRVGSGAALGLVAGVAALVL